MSQFPLLAVELDKPGALQQGHPAGREWRRGRGSSVGRGRVGRIGRGVGVVPSGGGVVQWRDGGDRGGRIGDEERRRGRAGGESEHEAAEWGVLHAFVGVGIWVGAGVGEGDGILERVGVGAGAFGVVEVIVLVGVYVGVVVGASVGQNWVGGSEGVNVARRAVKRALWVAFGLAVASGATDPSIGVSEEYVALLGDANGGVAKDGGSGWAGGGLGRGRLGGAGCFRGSEPR
jgi:hypothetical protein